MAYIECEISKNWWFISDELSWIPGCSYISVRSRQDAVQIRPPYEMPHKKFNLNLPQCFVLENMQLHNMLEASPLNKVPFQSKFQLIIYFRQSSNESGGRTDPFEGSQFGHRWSKSSRICGVYFWISFLNSNQTRFFSICSWKITTAKFTEVSAFLLTNANSHK